MAESHDLTWETDNKFIPKYIPGNLNWYEKDSKCEEFLNNTDLHFKKRHIIKF